MWSDKLFKMSNVVNNESLDDWGAIAGRPSSSSCVSDSVVNEDSSPECPPPHPTKGATRRCVAFKGSTPNVLKYGAWGSGISSKSHHPPPPRDVPHTPRGPWDVPPGNFIRKPIRLSPASADAPVPTRHLSAHSLADGRYEILDDYMEHGRFGV